MRGQQQQDDQLVIERPRAAAAALGVSLATFWRRAKEDPDFPRLVRLGPNMVGIIQSERLSYVRGLIAKRDVAG